MSALPLEYVPAIILAGGLGTRIRHLAPNLPKPMIPIRGRPFVEWIMLYLKRQGVQDFLLSTGYMSDAVEAYFLDHSFPGMDIHYAKEMEPLGTAGAILNALPFLEPGTVMFFVLNGDSILPFEAAKMVAMMDEDTEGVLLGVHEPDCSRFGRMEIANGELKAFHEKSPGAGIINGGVYLLRTEPFIEWPVQRMSFEQDLLPQRLAAGAKYKVVETAGPLLDIGTPESLASAEQYVAEAKSWLIGGA
jgi:D-glycero-alpha-D-manno-heptose 1-phosphate guanylyltransferase